MKAPPPKRPVAEQARSLMEFAIERRRAERRASCAICRLPDDVRAQLRAARDKKIDIPTRLAWLESLGHPVGELDLKTHQSSTHDSLDQQKAVTA